jgi:hypothetical protein
MIQVLHLNFFFESWWPRDGDGPGGGRVTIQITTSNRLKVLKKNIQQSLRFLQTNTISMELLISRTSPDFDIEQQALITLS